MAGARATAAISNADHAAATKPYAPRLIARRNAEVGAQVLGAEYERPQPRRDPGVVEAAQRGGGFRRQCHQANAAKWEAGRHLERIQVVGGRPEVVHPATVGQQDGFGSPGHGRGEIEQVSFHVPRIDPDDDAGSARARGEQHCHYAPGCRDDAVLQVKDHRISLGGERPGDLALRVCGANSGIIGTVQSSCGCSIRGAPSAWRSCHVPRNAVDLMTWLSGLSHSRPPLRCWARQQPKMEYSVMPTCRAFVASALLGAALSHPVQAQKPSNLDFLEGLSAQRNAEMKPRPDRPAPVPTQHEKIIPTRNLWVCMSTTPWQPVLASPNPRAPVIGQTQSMIAVSSAWVDGYAEVLHYNGKLGFIPASTVKPYHSDINPHGTCTIPGLRTNGTPVFDFR